LLESSLIILAVIFGLWLALTLWLNLRPGDGVDLPERRSVALDQLNIRYYQSGRGPDLILIHGLGASSYCWRYMIPRLAQHFKVTAIDMVGFGESAKEPAVDYTLDGQGERLHRILQALDIKSAILVGSSLGGLLALWLGRRYPQNYPRLITLSPAALGRGVHSYLPIWRPLLRLQTLYINRLTMPWMVLFVVGSIKPLTRESIGWYLKPFAHPKALDCLFNAFHAIHDDRLPKLFSGLSQPTLVIRGQGDWLVRQIVIDRLASQASTITVQAVASRHHPQEHIPSELCDRIRAWLESSTS